MEKKRESSSNFFRRLFQFDIANVYVISARAPFPCRQAQTLNVIAIQHLDQYAFATESLDRSTTSSTSAEEDVNMTTILEMSSQIVDETAQSDEAASVVSYVSTL